MKNTKSVNELISDVNEFLRNSNPDFLLSSDTHKALCYLADAVSQQQEVIDSLLEQLKSGDTVRAFCFACSMELPGKESVLQQTKIIGRGVA